MSTGGTYGMAYTYEERHLMVRMHNAGHTCKEIAEVLSTADRPQRSAGAIKTQLCNMGILNASMGLRNQHFGAGAQHFTDKAGSTCRAKTFVEPPGQAYVSTIPYPSRARLMAGK
jgi:hypothetical protein